MVKQYFVLGRNPELSREEIFSYLDARKLKYDEIGFEVNILLIDLPREININELGGTMRSGLIEIEGQEEIVEAHLMSQEVIDSDKFTYSVFGNIDQEVFKYKFKSEKKKAILKHGRTRVKLQTKENINIPKAEHYLILHKFEDKVYFGKINQEYDSKSIEYRDMKKPVRREHLAISPRLSKILINLSEAKDNDLLLDPFCGIGGILSEALLKEINVQGSDKDKLAIRDARKNLDWLRRKHSFKKRFNTETRDARDIKGKKFDAIVTETPLGEVVRKKPNDRLATHILEKFERMIIPILRNLKKVKKTGSKIAITFPRIRQHKINYERIVEETGLRIHKGPMLEAREKQFISRDIIVFE